MGGRVLGKASGALEVPRGQEGESAGEAPQWLCMGLLWSL